MKPIQPSTQTHIVKLSTLSQRPGRKRFYGAIAAISCMLYLQVCLKDSQATVDTQAFKQALMEYESSKATKRNQVEAKAELYHQISHAKELLGTEYQRLAAESSLKKGNRRIVQFIQEKLKKRLPARWKNAHARIARAIVQESSKHKMDPLFLLAIAESESSLNPEAKGSQGEIGFMQLMPKTARWIATKFKIPYHDEKSLYNPLINIQVSAQYLQYLRKECGNNSSLYLPAYNMGPGALINKLASQVWPKEYGSRVLHNYMQSYSDLQTFLNSRS